MDKALKTVWVKMKITGSTTDIGRFVEGQKMPLPPLIAKAAVQTGIAEKTKAPGGSGVMEVKTDG